MPTVPKLQVRVVSRVSNCPLGWIVFDFATKREVLVGVFVPVTPAVGRAAAVYGCMDMSAD